MKMDLLDWIKVKLLANQYFHEMKIDRLTDKNH